MNWTFITFIESLCPDVPWTWVVWCVHCQLCVCVEGGGMSLQTGVRNCSRPLWVVFFSKITVCSSQQILKQLFARPWFIPPQHTYIANNVCSLKDGFKPLGLCLSLNCTWTLVSWGECYSTTLAFLFIYFFTCNFFSNWPKFNYDCCFDIKR